MGEGPVVGRSGWGGILPAVTFQRLILTRQRETWRMRVLLIVFAALLRLAPAKRLSG